MPPSVVESGKNREKSADRIASLCTRIFLFTGLPALLALCLLVPPFQGSDEAAHFLRTLAVGQGQVLPQVMPHDPEFDGGTTAGGRVDAAAKQLAFGFELRADHLYGLPQVRAAAKAHAAGQLAYARHSNTAIYPPVTYLPASVAASLAAAAGLPVLAWLYLARIAGALVAGAILVRAIRRGGDAAPAFLIAATLPITLFQGAVLTTDAMMLPSLLLFGAMLWRIGTGATMTRADHVATAATLLVIALAKIAYLPMVVLPAFAAWLADGGWSARTRNYAVAAAVAIACWLGWAAVVHDKIFPMYPGTHVDTPGQIALLRTMPGRALGAIVRTMMRDLPSMTFGLTGSRLGQNDLFLPKPFIVLALAALIASALPAARPVRVVHWLLPAAVAVAVICYVAIYVLLYLQFNPVGAPTVEGVQSRYLTPLAFLLIAVAPRFAVGERGMRLTLTFVGLWSTVTCIVLPIATLMNYWRI